MRTIGVISDTHGLLRPEALAALEGSDLILHAGDVGDEEVLTELGRIAPTIAVRGNTDHGAFAVRLPASVVVDLAAADGVPRPERAHLDPGVTPDGGDPEGPNPDGAAPFDDDATSGAPLLAYMLHIREMLDLDPAAAGFRMVVFGHTHEPFVGRRDGVLWLNPGAAGHRRFRLPITVARVRFDPARPDRELEAQIVDLGVR